MKDRLPMDRRIVRARAIVLIVATVLLGTVTGVDAQTLTDPYAKTTIASPPTATTKSRTTTHVKNCSVYGAGFMTVPGTDACVKVGGGVTVEAGH